MGLDFAILVVVGVLAAVAGVAIGRRLAPGFGRLADRPQEDDGADD